MWFTRFESMKNLFLATLSAEAGELETARKIAFVNERLQNNFLILTGSRNTPTTPTDHDQLQDRSQGVARNPCGAH